MKTILFTGYYGFNNLGDDSFVEVCSWGAKKFWSPNKTSFLAPGNLIKNSINKVSGKFKFKGKYALESLLYGGASDYLIFGGGSLFHNQIQRFSAYDVYRHLAKAKITKVGAMGVSLGPFRTKKAYSEWKSFLADFEFIALRDTASFKISQEMNLNNCIQAYDLAALLPDILTITPNIGNENNLIQIGISICLDDPNSKSTRSNADRVKNLISLIQKVYDKNRSIKFLFFIINTNSLHGDELVTNNIIKELNIPIEAMNIVYYNDNIQEMWDHINGCNLVITSRLHPGIFAAFSDTPFLQIEYHKKCSDLLEDLGYPCEYRIGDLDLNIEDTVRLVFDILNEPSIISLKHKKQCQDLAVNNFKFKI